MLFKFVTPTEINEFLQSEVHIHRASIENKDTLIPSVGLLEKYLTAPLSEPPICSLGTVSAASATEYQIGGPMQVIMDTSYKYNLTTSYLPRLGYECTAKLLVNLQEASNSIHNQEGYVYLMRKVMDSLPLELDYVTHELGTIEVEGQPSTFVNDIIVTAPVGKTQVFVQSHLLTDKGTIRFYTTGMSGTNTMIQCVLPEFIGSVTATFLVGYA